MNIQDLVNCRISSVHYPGWDDYFDWSYTVVDKGTRFFVNKFYQIEKDEIVYAEKTGNRVFLTMMNGQRMELRLEV